MTAFAFPNPHSVFQIFSYPRLCEEYHSCLVTSRAHSCVFITAQGMTDVRCLKALEAAACLMLSIMPASESLTSALDGDIGTPCPL